MEASEHLVGTEQQSLVALLGGLLTLPESAHSSRELAMGVEAALVLDLDGGEPANVERVRSFLDEVEMPSPDSMPNPFVDLLTTPFGHSLARCSFQDDPVRNAEILIRAALSTFEKVGKRTPEDFCLATLAMMQEIANRSGWIPYEKPEGIPGEIPSLGKDFDTDGVASRVRFGSETLEEVVGEGWESLLAPWIFSADDPARNSAETHPLLRQREGGLIVCRPDSLASALAFALAEMLVDLGHADELEEQFADAAAGRTVLSLMEFANLPIGPAPDIPAQFAHSSTVMILDVDALLHVVVLTPEFASPVPSSRYMWSPPALNQLPPHLSRIEKIIGADSPPGSIVIHLVIAEGGGMQPLLPTTGFPDDKQVLLLSGSELEWLARHPDTTVRELRAFSHDLCDLRERIPFHPVSQFDAYALWRSEATGFAKIEYASTKAGSQSTVLACGGGLDLRMEVLERYEPTIAPAPDAGAWWLVGRHLEYEDVDLWRPWGSPKWPPHLYVPGIGEGVWVLTGEGLSDDNWHLRRKWNELFAYWIWALRDQLADLKTAALRLRSPLVVSVEILYESEAPGRAGIDTPYEIETDEVVNVRINAGAIDLLGGPTADPEHQLVTEVLEALASVARSHVPDKIIFPSGLRKLVWFDVSDPAFRDIHLAPVDLLPSYQVRAHRAVAAALVANLRIPEGPIEDLTQINAALHLGVEVLFSRIQENVSALDAEHTLPMLVASYEKLLHDSAIAESELVAINEFFGHHEDARQKRIREWQNSMTNSVACRFLIEFCAATPPNGELLPSDFQIQDLLASAVSLIELGNLSDLINFDLTERVFASIVPPGIFFAQALDVAEAQGTFTSETHHSDVERSSARRDEMLGLSQPIFVSAEAEERVERAFLEDHGYTTEDIALILNALNQVPENVVGSTEIAYHQALEIARNAVPDSDRAELVLEDLSLGARESFLPPGEPFSSRDVYPWRNARRLSYLRRPLLKRNGSDPSEATLLYGRGASSKSVQYLLWLRDTARLGSEGSASREASIHLQQELSRQFESDCGAILTRDGNWRVELRVRQLGAKRIERDGQDLGDIDILGINEREKIIVCIEAKRLAGATAPHQLHNELESTFVGRPSKRSAADKHLARCEFIRRHIPETLRLFAIEPSEGWVVRACLVTDTTVLSPLLKACPLPVLSSFRLAEYTTDGTLLAHIR